MANYLPPSCRGVLLVLTLVTIAHAAAVATTVAPAAAPELACRLVSGDYSLPPPPAAASAAVPTGGAAASCVQSIVKASVPCARDVIQTLIFKAVHLSADCCRVLAGVGEECVAAVFTDGGPALLPVVNRVCGLVASIG
ncbi:hypothetical protein HU200_010721 [Digitaria exilis]|uniref:Prolamin-like domain-containing protein n=1 Tax=Digitaria exilis TaxID=1010633 RepID=A0A835FHR6_9POAL|nr:hypothetical protein HU200_010721 [Digitaria exilis]